MARRLTIEAPKRMRRDHALPDWVDPQLCPVPDGLQHNLSESHHQRIIGDKRVEVAEWRSTRNGIPSRAVRRSFL